MGNRTRVSSTNVKHSATDKCSKMPTQGKGWSVSRFGGGSAYQKLCPRYFRHIVHRFLYEVYKRYGKQHLKDDAKRTPLRNVSFFSEYLSQGESESWSLGRKQNWQFLSDKQGFSNQRGRRKSGTSHRSQVPDWEKSYRKNKRGIWSNPDDADDEVMFETSFGRDRYCFWSFRDQVDVQWRNPSCQFSNKEKRNSRTMHEDSYDTEYKAATIGSASDRTILGLAAVGPLKLDDVKNAFRMCALKWHPDRHQGPSKVMAEEKFKHCCAAYKSLCDAFTTT